MPISMASAGLPRRRGMLTLADKIKKLGKNFVVLGPYDQDAWQQAADDLDRCGRGAI